MHSSFAESRRGQFTASKIHALLGKGKGGEDFSQGGYTYINEKIAECVTGESQPSAKTAATEWGNEHEKDAVMWFELITGKKVQHFGTEKYTYIPYNDYSGCSPDGIIIGESEIIQVKCPFLASNYIPYLIGPKTQEWLKKYEPEYYSQCQFEMMCNKATKCYFAVYYPATIEHQHRMVIIELLPDEELQTLIHDKIQKAAKVVRNALKILNDMLEVNEPLPQMQDTDFENGNG